MSVASLPDELLLQVFRVFQLPTPTTLGCKQHDQFAPHQQRDSPYRIKHHLDDEHTVRHQLELRTLSSITQCCKRFRQIANPVLYQGFPGYKIANPTRFISILIERPDLASCVKELVLDEWVPRENLHRISSKTGYASWLNCIQQFGLGRDLVRFIQMQPMKAIEEVQVALILFLCTEVTSLDLTASTSWGEGFMARLCEELVKERPNTLFRGEQDAHTKFGNLPLRRLRELSLRFGQNENTATVFQFETLLRLPTIQNLSIYRFKADNVDFLTRMPQVRELCLWRCTIAEGWVREALKSLPNLISLTVIWAGYSMRAGQAISLLVEIDYHELSKAICKYTPKLQSLTIDSREVGAFGRIVYPDPPHMDSLDLSGHSSLEVLSVEARAIWRGHVGKHPYTQEDCEYPKPICPVPRLLDVMPRSLKTLAVLVDRRYSRTYRGAELVMLDCLRTTVQAYTALKSIHIDLDIAQCDGGHVFGPFSESDEQCLRKMGWKRLSVVNEPMLARRNLLLGGGMTTDWASRMMYDLGEEWGPGYKNTSTKMIRVQNANMEAELFEQWTKALEVRIATSQPRSNVDRQKAEDMMKELRVRQS